MPTIRTNTRMWHRAATDKSVSCSVATPRAEPPRRYRIGRRSSRRSSQFFSPAASFMSRSCTVMVMGSPAAGPMRRAALSGLPATFGRHGCHGRKSSLANTGTGVVTRRLPRIDVSQGAELAIFQESSTLHRRCVPIVSGCNHDELMKSATDSRSRFRVMASRLAPGAPDTLFVFELLGGQMVSCGGSVQRARRGS
jgi:hypothetical protein